MKKILILGGGIAGLSAAHELVERGFDVELLEARSTIGGKARSIAVPRTGRGGRADLPGEHGFRFFPGFYRHLPDTMSRIPFGDLQNGVLDNLVEASQFQIAAEGRPEVVMPARLIGRPRDTIRALSSLLEFAKLGIPRAESRFFCERLFVYLTSCDERRIDELEQISWWRFIGAESRSAEYQIYFGKALTQALVAVRAEQGSARTTASTFAQLALDLLRRGRSFDRVLNGPTDEAWIRPWLVHLRQRGVRIRLGVRVEAIRCEGATITSVLARDRKGALAAETADYYLAALPVDALIPLVTEPMMLAEPALARLPRLTTAWMNGIQFYLRKDIPLVHGHLILPATPWALTCISQAQFWAGELDRFGDGQVKGILSVCISDWETPGVLYGKPARALLHATQIRDEVWAQLTRALSSRSDQRLRAADVVDWFLDPSIEIGDGYLPRNQDPLLVNTIGSWHNRPEALTAIPNLFLAADYVRTHTDVASMEAANEAARRAVNGILDAAASVSPRCAIWRLEEPASLRPLRFLDALRYKRGLPHRSWKMDGDAAATTEAAMSDRGKAPSFNAESPSEIPSSRDLF